MCVERTKRCKSETNRQFLMERFLSIIYKPFCTSFVFFTFQTTFFKVSLKLVRIFKRWVFLCHDGSQVEADMFKILPKMETWAFLKDFKLSGWTYHHNSPVFPLWFMGICLWMTVIFSNPVESKRSCSSCPMLGHMLREVKTLCTARWISKPAGSDSLTCFYILSRQWSTVF